MEGGLRPDIVSLDKGCRKCSSHLDNPFRFLHRVYFAKGKCTFLLNSIYYYLICTPSSHPIYE